MGQTTGQIEAHIRETRGDLGSNLDELERKVKSVTDWKHRFRTNPMTMLGVAFGGGVVLASIMGGRRNRRRGGPGETNRPAGGVVRTRANYQNKAMETWDNVKGALMGVAATRFTNFVGELVPGFNEKFQHTGQQTEPVRTTGGFTK